MGTGRRRRQAANWAARRRLPAGQSPPPGATPFPADRARSATRGSSGGARRARGRGGAREQTGGAADRVGPCRAAAARDDVRRAQWGAVTLRPIARGAPGNTQSGLGLRVAARRGRALPRRVCLVLRVRAAGERTLRRGRSNGPFEGVAAECAGSSLPLNFRVRDQLQRISEVVVLESGLLLLPRPKLVSNRIGTALVPPFRPSTLRATSNEGPCMSLVNFTAAHVTAAAGGRLAHAARGKLTTPS